MLVYNATSNLGTLRGNAAFSLAQLPSRLHALRITWDGQILWGYMVHAPWSPGVPRETGSALERTSGVVHSLAGFRYHNQLEPAFWIALALTPLLWRTRARKPMLFCLIAMTVAWIEMAITKDAGLGAHHVVLLWPLPHWFIAVAFVEASRWKPLEWRKAGAVALVGVMVFLAGENLLLTNEYFYQLTRYGSLGSWSDAIYQLSEEVSLMPSPPAHIIVDDWGISNSLEVLRGGNVSLVAAQDFNPRLASDVWIGHTPEYQQRAGGNERVVDGARLAGFEKQVIQTVPDRNGRAVFEIFRFKAADSSELRGRRERAAAGFSDGILLVHAASVADESAPGFRQDPAFYYFTSLENIVGGILAIDGRSHESWLFLDGSRDSDAVKRAGIEHVAEWSELPKYLERNGRTTLYYSAVKYSRPELPPNITGGPPNAPLWVLAIAKKSPALRLTEARARVSALMDVQSPSELVNVRAAAKATVQAAMAGMRAIKPGVSQRSVEATVEDTCWRAGAHGASFWPWAMAGTDGVFPKPFASLTRYDHLNAVMNAGDLVRLDVGCEWNHYGGDLGRTVPVSGRYSAEQREIWNIFVSAYHAGAKSLREGATVDQIFEAWRSELVRHRESAKSALARQAVDEWSKREKMPYWQIHTMNLDEGGIRGPLRAGTTVAFEPIASIGGQGYYLEDLFLITREGAELLTPGVPYSTDEIEAAMRAGGK